MKTNPSTTDSIKMPRLGPRGVKVEARADGTKILRPVESLGTYPRSFTERMLHWAEKTPDAIVFAQRHPDGRKGDWMTMTYAQFAERFCRIAQALLNRNLSTQRPVLILSENDFENVLLHMAAMHVGIPYAPVSPSYSLLSTDHSKLKAIMRIMNPGLVFASDGDRFAKAIAASAPDDAEIVFTRNAPGSMPSTPFEKLLAEPAGKAVDDAFAKVGPDTIGKFLFTSGSTGAPKSVILTQRHICSQRQQVLQLFPFLETTPPVLVDWLPWHHVFGGTSNLGTVLWSGGTYYIDHGKPMPGLIDASVQALREVAPTIYLNVPKAFELIIPYLRSEPELRARFFSRLEFIMYGAASFPGHLWDAMDELAVQETGRRVLITAGLGSTECGPTVVFANWEPPKKQPVVGLPVPGVELKLVPHGEKLEIRYKGPCICTGYWHADDLTRAAFDEEGYFKSADAVKFVNPDDPQEGLMFNGRITEDFKLLTGAWVNVMSLRNLAIGHFSPYVFDVVIAGHNQDDVTGIVFPQLDACRALANNLDAHASPAEVLASPAVRRKFQELLDSLGSTSTGSSTRIARIVLEAEPPTLDNGEMADKGTVAQRMVLERRINAVTELYSSPRSRRVIACQT